MHFNLFPFQYLNIEFAGASTPPAQGSSRRSQQRQQERDDAWQRERERAVAVSHPVSSPKSTKADSHDDTRAGEDHQPARVPPSFDDPTQWGLENHYGGLRTPGSTGGTHHATDLDTDAISPESSSTSTRQPTSGEQTRAEVKQRSPAGQRISPRTSGSYRLPETKHAFGESERVNSLIDR